MESSGSSPLPLASLKPKMRLEGRVTKISMTGAFVDVGAEQPGLVHISQLKRGHVNRVEDAVQQGQEVEVWVLRVDPANGRLELTMIPPVVVEWSDVKPGARLRGKVVRLERFGAFVDVGAERPGLVHISEMSNEYVGKPGDIVKEGEEIDVVVLDVDRQKRQIRFSMKAAEAPSVEPDDDEGEAPMPTAMELALRQAMQGAPATNTAVQSTPPRHVRQRSTQEDILARTLQGRVRTSPTED